MATWTKRNTDPNWEQHFCPKIFLGQPKYTSFNSTMELGTFYPIYMQRELCPCRVCCHYHRLVLPLCCFKRFPFWRCSRRYICSLQPGCYSVPFKLILFTKLSIQRSSVVKTMRQTANMLWASFYTRCSHFITHKSEVTITD